MARFIALGLYLVVIGGTSALAANLFPEQGQAAPRNPPTASASDSTAAVDESAYWPAGAVAAIPPGPLPVATTSVDEAEPAAPPSVWLPGVYTVVADPVAPAAPPTAPTPPARAGTGSVGNSDRADLAALPDRDAEATGELGAGLYASSDDATECGYALTAGRDGSGRLVAEDALGQGRLLVTVEAGATDRFASSAGCGHWTEWAAPAEPLAEAGNGDYWTGDLAAGDWDLPAGCRWEEVSAFRGTQLAALTDSTAGPGQVSVDADTLGIRLRGCNTPATLSTSSASSAPPSTETSSG